MTGPAIQIVDPEDNPLRGGTREEAKADGLWHRIVRVIVESPSGKLLLQKRSAQVFYSPNKWDNSAAGHVDEGETYETAAKRELEEELGITAPVEKIDYYKWARPDETGLVRYAFVTTYRVIIDESTKFTLQSDEVAEVRWFEVAEIKRLFKDEPDSFTAGIQELIKLHYSDNPS